MTKQFNKLINAINNDKYIELTINNARIRYDTTKNNLACGVLSFADEKNFDRWANSRIIQVHTTMIDSRDPNLKHIIKNIINIF